MLRRLRIRDFQSLEDVTLDLSQLTVILGPTNSGKTAVVRAIQAALFNRTGGEFVRGDEKESYVQLIFDNGKVEWTKPRRGGAVYVLGRVDVTDDMVITRPGHGMPLELEEMTGVREVVGDGFKARLQFDGQFSEPFLLAGTGGQAAKLLARVSKLDVLVAAQVMAKRDAGRVRAKAQEAEGRQEQLEQRLMVQPDYAALLEEWRALSERNDRWLIAKANLIEALSLAAESRSLEVLRQAWAQAKIRERLTAVTRLHQEVESVAKALVEVQGTEGAQATASGSLESARRDLVTAEKEYADMVGDLKICPVCGRPM